MFAAFYFRGPPDLHTTPGAVAHEWHQGFPAAAVGAAARISLVGIESIGFCFEARAITPGAIIPVILDTAFTARAVCGHATCGTTCRIVKSAPGACLHAFADRSLTAAALVPCVENTLELPLKLAPLHPPPGRALPIEFLGARTPLPACAAMKLVERGLHLNRVSISVCRIEVNGLAKHLGKFRPDPFL